MENICFIKLINGDDIIATVDLEDEEDILILACYLPLYKLLFLFGNIFLTKLKSIAWV